MITIRAVADMIGFRIAEHHATSTHISLEIVATINVIATHTGDHVAQVEREEINEGKVTAAE